MPGFTSIASMRLGCGVPIAAKAEAYFPGTWDVRDDRSAWIVVTPQYAGFSDPCRYHIMIIEVDHDHRGSDFRGRIDAIDGAITMWAYHMDQLEKILSSMIEDLSAFGRPNEVGCPLFPRWTSRIFRGT